MSINDAMRISPKSQDEWRDWLEENHVEQDSVWVVMYKKAAPFPTVTWSKMVDVALCYGWIDSVRRPLDEFSSLQYYSKRKANSTWSKINKDKVENLIELGLMRAAGLKCIEVAKKNGSWTVLDSVEALLVPEDLKVAFDERAGSAVYFENLSKSMRKMMLYWVVSAKRPETRAKRITEIADHASRGERPKSFR